jgi:hypothetical protein
MAAEISFVARDKDWSSSDNGATYTATSTAAGSDPDNAGTDDPSLRWTAASGTATLTATLGATRTVSSIGLFSTNADDGKVITIAGGITGSPTLTGNHNEAGEPQDLIYVVNPPQSLSQVTFAISGNSVNWSIGRVLVAEAGTLPNFRDGFTPEPTRAQYRDRNDFGHTDIYDLGVELWTLRGDLVLTWAQQRTLDAWWRSTKGGFYPTVIIPDATQYPPFLVQMAMSLPRKHDNKHLRTSLVFEQVCQGLEVAL